MTKVRFHGPIAGFSGAMGEIVFADQKKKNQTVAYMKTHYELTEAQVGTQDRFKEAARLANAALDDPARRAFYQAIADEKDSSAYHIAFTDYLVLPRFKPLNLSLYKGQVGDPILIRAVDDIGMADVEVTLTANDGSPIEQGKAVEAGKGTGMWTYTATQPVALGSDIFIEVIGFDHAGSRAQISESPRVGEDE
jgi:hypothetical protein